jgi:hypothetical protein
MYGPGRSGVRFPAAALDTGDQAAIDGFINNTLAYCEDLLEPV